jgi:biopolymer transport protein ExbD
MNFSIRKRRQTPAVIIVALIDVLIVLLIFLLVTTTFRQQPALRLSLPESTQAQKSGETETPPLVVSIDPQGTIRFGPDARPVTFDQLKMELTTQVARDPKRGVSINADKSAPFGQVIRVMDAAKESNIKMVNAYMEKPKP